jgi:WD40 repeat protein
MINDSPSTIHSHALSFSPSSSWFHQYYSSELLHEVKVIKGLPGWGKCFRTVELPETWRTFACCKNTIAVSSERGEIIILDAVTGSQIAVHSGHTGRVRALAFSTNGSLLVSGSNDKTVKLWDMQTGGVIKTFYGHTYSVYSVSISGDCATIASGSEDETVRLWDIQTGECCCIIQQENWVKQVHFFPLNPKHLISVSGDKVWQWNIDGQQIGSTYYGSCATFSLDGTKLALFNEGVVQIQDPDSGAIIAKFHTPVQDAHFCCFSPDGRLVAIATDSLVYVWDITNPDPCIFETFVSENDHTQSLVFSSPTSLISKYDWRSVKFWQISASLPASGVSNFPIQSITLQATDGVAISSDSDGVVRFWNLSTGICNMAFQTPAKGTCRRDIKLIDNRWTLVWHMPLMLHIWAIEEGKLLQTIDIAENKVEALQISGDGSKVFYISDSFLKALHLWTGKFVGKVYINPRSQWPFLVVDGSRVWVNNSKQIEGWDFGIPGSSSIKACFTPPNRPHLDFVGGIRHHRTLLPSIEDTITGKEFLRLPEGLRNPTDAQWDGQYLVAGYEAGDVLILKCICTVSH